ncbi:MAG: DUF3783 domain-containing protein [Ruminococcus sp.]|nr:DUF3783 domain-containing protein [Ruminococcus sp.]
MKARIRTYTQKQVLALGLTDDKLTALDELCKKESIKLIKASPDQGGEKVGALLGLTGFSLNGKGDITVNSELLLISGFDERELRTFVGKLRPNGISVPLKASLTDTNKDWTLSQLAGHIAEEHEYMTKGKE